ncbi:MAG: 23S rRNA (Uracil-5-)-methyltransferase [Candidatus Uhrbacteria bacterium GW2011_GWE2_46_68]|uniref:23S rRNA (Uracil-5-)-methyltransferase n=2 Tax=Candidatus Uhriibacteriota TaxID=1752732 RepID=A0A0G1Q863_9BACT|nr:MAG: 23S rRNA (Uracil-5-)-methyltransferase [Candidatus Uhrbacteria bacterium GW2011_GWF2_46_218]KKU41032.1 MAG: 23S rRNA (Uracil-5-)-methyltransferase [Candidatus Uhrbacteria bacterium GW2011_GWE2_46_68]
MSDKTHTLAQRYYDCQNTMQQTFMSSCPQKDRCGSCGWSHIPYQKQLAQKLADINGSLALKKLSLRCKEILPSPRIEHYRNRMDFVIDFEGRMGLREKGKWWKVIDGHPCFLADEKIESLFHSIHAWLPTSGLTYFDRKAATGLLRYAVIRALQTGETMVDMITSAPVDSFEEERTHAAFFSLAQHLSPTSFFWSINSTISDVSFGDKHELISGRPDIEEVVDHVRYQIGPHTFFQTNSHASPLLLQTVKEFAGPVKNKTVLDLYCGTGFFALAFAKDAKRTIGVELAPEAIVEAKENARINELSAEFFDAKTESFPWQDFHPDVVILDPPRAGMHDRALKDILEAKPPRIVYVSCNYKNFAREMVILQNLYRMENIRAMDMFPHTPHVELVAALTLSD